MPGSAGDDVVGARRTFQDALILGDWTTLAVELNGQVIGDVVAHVDPTGGVAEIGYTLARPRHGKGYAREAASALVEHLFGSPTSGGC